MPYRRLPNTDKARLRALETAFSKVVTEDISAENAFSEDTLTKIQEILPKFNNAIINLEATRKQQFEKNKDYLEISKKAKLYISHFIQVLTFSIQRGEMKSEIRELYSLSTYKNNLPPLSSDKNLVEWGKILIEGEQKRIIKGGNPIYNPSIALVKVNYEKFIDAYRFQNILVANTNRLAATVNMLRKEADGLIVTLWNEIEKFFENYSEEDKRDKASEYGLVYVWRKKELKKIKQQELLEKQERQKKEDTKVEVDSVLEIMQPQLIMQNFAEKTVNPIEPRKVIIKKHKEERTLHSPVQAILNF